MAGSTVAELDRRGTELQVALAEANQTWNDSRRQSMDGRYLHPHGDAHDRLRTQLTLLFSSSGQARLAAGNADQAVAAARREGAQANHPISGARLGMAQSESAAQVGLSAETHACQAHERTVRLAESANFTSA